ncbi:MAG: hypothetical protein CVU38_20725 [Chloroflexi bacterium HGW-Chloroflexi-1]|nr:MAG: hypothetical protein CVU38_20725 [Chloroflexi bacterium HGW-Chloroflexi-1]
MTLIDLAGWRVRLTCRPDVLAAAVAVRYAAFAAPAGPVALEAQVTLDGALRAAPGPEITVRASVDGCLGSKYLFDTPGFSGIINFASGKAGLALSSAAALEDVEYFLRIVYALVADCEGGLLIHAAGLVVDGGVHLFTGQSGSGKSTVVTLSPHAIALGDDLILLRPGADGWTAHGTPFWNAETLQRADQTASGPLVGIYNRWSTACPTGSQACWPAVGRWRRPCRWRGCTSARIPTSGECSDALRNHRANNRHRDDCRRQRHSRP